jgi:hypothetical protein
MADEWVTAEVEGKQFKIRVPKGSDDEFVNQAALDHYDRNFAPRKQLNESLGNQGFLSSLGESIKGLGAGIIKPYTDIKEDFFPNKEQAAQQNVNEQRMSEEPKEFLKDQYERSLPFATTVSKLGQGNISGAIGDILPQVALSLMGSPKLRGGVGGAIEGAGRTTSSLIKNAGPIERGMGAGLGTLAAHQALPGLAGYMAGAPVGAAAISPMMHPIEMAKGIGKGAMQGAAGEDFLPNFRGKKPYFFQEDSSTFQKQPPSRGPVKLPSKGEITSGQRPQVNLPKELPQGTFDQVPNAPKQIQKPSTITPAPSIYKPGSEPAPFGSQEVPKVKAPTKETTQQIPAVIKSVKEELPSSVKLSPEEPKVESKVEEKSEEKVQKSGKEIAQSALKKSKENVVTTPKEGKPYINHDNLYNIAREIGVIPTVLARHMIETDYAEVQPSKFGDWTRERPTKIEPTEAQKLKKTADKAASDKLIKTALPQISKAHPEWFK